MASSTPPCASHAPRPSLGCTPSELITQHACSWSLQGEDGRAMKEQLQRTFRNITRIMDCVGCEKCKLWGKLQILGASPPAARLGSAAAAAGAAAAAAGAAQGFIPGTPMSVVQEVSFPLALLQLPLMLAGMGTALKILFEEAPSGRPPALGRNEVIALINFLGRLSSSVEAIREMDAMIEAGPAAPVPQTPEGGGFSYNAYIE